MRTRFVEFISRIHDIVSRRRLDEESKREVDVHFEMLVDEYRGRGLSPAEASRRARLRLGGALQAQEIQRGQRGFPRLELVLQDLRYALRVLRKAPAFTFVAVLTLAIGIGANTAMFSIVQAVLLRPLPFHEPDRLVRIFETNPLKHWTRTVAAPANFADWQRRNSVFTDMAAYNGTNDRGASTTDLFLTGNGEPQRLKAVLVTGNLFRVLGVAPQLGRTFADAETFQPKSRVALLSYGLWQTLFAGDPDIVGHPIVLSGLTCDIVGVMPRGFCFPGCDAQLWVPLGVTANMFAEVRRPHFLEVVARLRPGVTLGQARADLEGVAARLEQLYPDTNTRMGVRLEPFHDSLAYGVASPLVLLLGAVGVVFLIVCVNLAGLQIGRGAARVHEIAVRRALGATRARLVRQLVTEGLVLSVVGGAFGLLLAYAAGTALAQFAPTALPGFADLRIDRAVLAFDIVLSIAAPIIFGLAPAIGASRSDTLHDRSETASTRTRTIRDVLVAFEVALSVVLVVGAGLLVRSLARLDQVQPGFNPARVVRFEVRFPTARYPDDPHTLAAIEDIERRVRALPGIDSVGATTTLPLNGYFWTGDATVEGHAGDDYERELRHEVVTPGYFQTIGVPLVRGRFLTDADRPPHAPVTLVNETLATKYFGGADPVGRRIKFGRPQDKDEWTTIVGIVGDVKQDAMDVAVQPEVYEPLAQNSQNRVSFVVRSALPPDALMAAVRPQVHAVDKDLALTDAGRLGEVVHNATADQRFRTSVLAAFAIVALFLAALGIYGVVAYFVAHRSRELGIRLALGASVADVFGIVLRQGMLPVIAGALAGLAVASAAAGLIRSLLFGIEPLDPMTYGSAVLTLCVVAVGACALPAARAVRIDPASALRDE